MRSTPARPHYSIATAVPSGRGTTVALLCAAIAACGSPRSLHGPSGSGDAQPEAAVSGRGPSSFALVLPPPEAVRTGCSVVLYGDSILHGGYGGSKRLDEPPAQTLRRIRPRYTVEDRTVNGETASDRSKSFGGEPRSARFVVLGHGINDVARNLELEPALRRMVTIARAEGRMVILTGLSRQPVAVPGRAQGDATVRRISTELQVGFADWGSVPYERHEMADVLHPGKLYSDRLVQRIAESLDQMAPECAQPAAR